MKPHISKQRAGFLYFGEEGRWSMGTYVRLIWIASLLFILLIISCAPVIMRWNKEGASYEQFMKDRYDCIMEAQQRVSGAYVNQYGGASSSRVVPSFGIFSACMQARGYYPDQNIGFAPAPGTEVRMTR